MAMSEKKGQWKVIGGIVLIAIVLMGLIKLSIYLD